MGKTGANVTFTGSQLSADVVLLMRGDPVSSTMSSFGGSKILDDVQYDCEVFARSRFASYVLSTMFGCTVLMSRTRPGLRHGR